MITPEIAKKYAEEDYIVLQKMEDYTDIFLKNNFFGEAVKIPASDFKKCGPLTAKIKMAFLNKYASSGWKVELIDEDNVQFIQFSVESVPRSLESTHEFSNEKE